jgi:hypothetical protein
MRLGRKLAVGTRQPAIIGPPPRHRQSRQCRWGELATRSDFSGFPCPSASDLDGQPRFPANFDVGVYHLWLVRRTEFIPFPGLCQANAVGAVLQSGPRVPPGVRHAVLAVRTRGPYNGGSSGRGCKWWHSVRRGTFFQRRTENRKSHTVMVGCPSGGAQGRLGAGQRRTSTAWQR